jgi:hypothetical protein
LIRALAVLATVGLVAALVLTGTIDLQSAFGISQEEFAEAREILLEEDFGVGIYLGGDFDRIVRFLGRPASSSEIGRTKTAEYLVPIGRASTPADSQGTLEIVAEDNIITSVTLTFNQWTGDISDGDVRFGGIGLENLEPDDLIELFGKPAARFVVLNNKVFAWFLLPPLKTEEGVQFDLSRTMEVTANFNKGDGRLRKLSVKVPKQKGQ